MYHGEAASNLSPVLDILSILTMALVNTGLLLLLSQLLFYNDIVHSETEDLVGVAFCLFRSLMCFSQRSQTKPQTEH